MTEQSRTPEKELNETEITNLNRRRVQNTGNQDAQRTHSVWQWHKKDPRRNKAYIK